MKKYALINKMILRYNDEGKGKIRIRVESLIAKEMRAGESCKNRETAKWQRVH